MRTSLEVESWEDTKARLLRTARQMDKGEQITPVRRITFETAADLLACLTPRRRELLAALRERPTTASALAALLNRKKAAVDRDVKAMRAAGLLKVRAQRDLQTNERVITARKKIELRAML